MKTIFVLVLISIPCGLFAQATPFYLAGGLDNFTDQQMRGDGILYVTYQTGDSLVLSPGSDDNKYASTYKRSPGEPFMRRIHGWGSSLTNYAWVSGRSLMVIEDNGSYLAFSNDQQHAQQVMEEPDKSRLLALRDSLKGVIDNNNGKLEVVNKKLALKATAKDKILLSAYLRNLHPTFSDPRLVKQIVKWSKNATTKVYIVGGGYSMVRNSLGIVVWKSIDCLIVYQRDDGKCYLEWRIFGYDYVGGGQFSPDMSTYINNGARLNANGPGGMKELELGAPYEVDCR